MGAGEFGNIPSEGTEGNVNERQWQESPAIGVAHNRESSLGMICLGAGTLLE